MCNGKSLLPAGVKKINGIFEKGDHILVKDQNNTECARGLASFSSIEMIFKSTQWSKHSLHCHTLVITFYRNLFYLFSRQFLQQKM